MAALINKCALMSVYSFYIYFNIMKLFGIVVATGILTNGLSLPWETSRSAACLLNRDRQSRFEQPLFVHQSLMAVAQQLGDSYANGTFQSSTFNQLYKEHLQQLGDSVQAYYKILGYFDNTRDYVQELENQIYSTIFKPQQQAIGVYQSDGIYTIVLVYGLKQTPDVIKPCPNQNDHPFVPTDQNVLNGIDLPMFLCQLNSRRIQSSAPAFAVHKALELEAQVQAQQMVQLGHMTVDGPRKVDDDIYGKGVRVRKLYWVAGDGYSGSGSLVNVLVENYPGAVLDGTYRAIGVAQEQGYWSVILAQLYVDPRNVKECPEDLNDVTFVS